MSVTDRTILLAGATSASGLAVARALVDGGARVVATGRSAERLEPLRAIGAEVDVADATSLESMADLATRLESVDAVIPLVGGWRGGGGLAGQTDADFGALLPALDAVRASSRAL
uniref:SDR family NAD(P)-dependent oxidoreductase n=1 Tax=Microbacterium sp. TaxID=51671 RepID=UPI00289D8F5C